jgi:hypothetical protein
MDCKEVPGRRSEEEEETKRGSGNRACQYHIANEQQTRNRSLRNTGKKERNKVAGKTKTRQPGGARNCSICSYRADEQQEEGEEIRMIQNADSQADSGHRDETVDKTHQHNNNNNNKSEEERRESRPTKKDLQDVQKPRFLLLSGGCGGRVRGFAIRIR